MTTQDDEKELKMPFTSTTPRYMDNNEDDEIERMLAELNSGGDENFSNIEKIKEASPFKMLEGNTNGDFNELETTNNELLKDNEEEDLMGGNNVLIEDDEIHDNDITENYNNNLYNDKTQDDEEEEEDEYDDDDDEIADSNDFYDQEDGKKLDGRLYQNELTKPIFKVGNTEIGLSQAKLFGLLDDNGELKLKNVLPKVNKKKSAIHMRSLSKPRSIPVIIDEEEAAECTFKPTKDPKAVAAMNQKNLGYDFADRLGGGVSFLDRLKSANDGKTSKALLAKEEEDYDARLDKLGCPKCKREQTFDEYSQNRRTCSQCNHERFIKLNIVNMSLFEKRMKEAEDKRKLNILAADQKIYGADGGFSKQSKTQYQAKQPSILPRSTNSTRNVKVEQSLAQPKNNKIREPREREVKNQSTTNEILKALDQVQNSKPSIGLPPVELLQKLAALQNEKESLLNETVKRAESKLNVRVNEKNNSKPPRTSSAPAPSKGNIVNIKTKNQNVDNVSTNNKFNELLKTF